MEELHATLEDALVHGVWRRDLTAVDRLLKTGANPNLPGRVWSSAIACAGENDETGDIVRALIAGGADINLQNDQGLTPLHYAVDMAIDGAIQQGLDTIDWSVVGVLLDLGADPSIRDAQGETVYDTASAYGDNARRSFDDFMQFRASRGWPVAASSGLVAVVVWVVRQQEEPWKTPSRSTGRQGLGNWSW